MDNAPALKDIEFNLVFIAQNAHNLPEEIIAAALEYGKTKASQLRDLNQLMEIRLSEKMKAENATKLVFKNTAGQEMIATLKTGSVKCDSKDPDIIYQEQGFDPLEIGEYVFKPSWSKAKEHRKLGGQKQIVIDNLFKPGKDTITF